MWNYFGDYNIKSTFIDIDDKVLDEISICITNLYEQLPKKDASQKITPNSFNFGFERSVEKHSSILHLEKRISEKFSEEVLFKVHWSKIYKRGQTLPVHNHATTGVTPNEFAFVFYVDAPEGSGQLVFPDLGIEITPKEKMFVMFDNSYNHEVLPSTCEERIITSGNIKVGNIAGTIPTNKFYILENYNEMD